AKVSRNITPNNVLTILITNVRMDNEETDKFINMVDEWDPDIILVNEPDEKWAKAIGALDFVYEYQIKEPLPNTYGMIYYSKLPLSEEKVRYLVDEDVPSV